MLMETMYTYAQHITKTRLLALQYHNTQSSYNCWEVTVKWRHYSLFRWFGIRGCSAPSNCTTIHMSLQQLWLPYTLWQIWHTFQNIFLHFSQYVTKFQADSQTTVNLCQENLPFVKHFSTSFTNCIFHTQNIPHVCCEQAEKLCNIQKRAEKATKWNIL
jgi:hypothetical protein